MVESRRYSNSCFEARQYGVMLMMSTMMIPMTNLKTVDRQPDLLCLDQDAVKCKIDKSIQFPYSSFTYSQKVSVSTRIRVLLLGGNSNHRVSKRWTGNASKSVNVADGTPVIRYGLNTLHFRTLQLHFKYISGLCISIFLKRTTISTKLSTFKIFWAQKS